MRRDNHRCMERTKPQFEPIVEIRCKDAEEQQVILTTSNSFVSAAMAEYVGQNMAREWIDGHFK